MSTLLQPNGTPIVQGQFDIDLGDYVVEAGGEKVTLRTALESLLFVATTPVEVKQLETVLNLEAEIIANGLHQLAQEYKDRQRGLRLQAREGKFQLVTIPATASLVEDFLNLDLSVRLSTPALESLAVVAYRQPVTRAQIEAVRGVDSAGVLRSLLQRGLIEEIGRLEVAGRPILYGVTDLFMQHFGLTALSELPPLEANDQDLLQAATKLAELEVVEA
jgi:segregation and condensation protein B